MITEIAQSGPIPFRSGFSLGLAKPRAERPDIPCGREESTREANLRTLAAQYAATGILLLLLEVTSSIATYELEAMLR